MDEIETVLSSLEPAAADGARAVLESLLGPEGERVPLSTMTQLDLQELLWHRLPTRWLVADSEHHEIAWALGDFLEAAGLDRYAELCRAARTHEILAAWHRDQDAGREAAREAQRDSGVLPPDTDLLTFGELMGGDEARVNAGVSALLERRIAAGELDPTVRGFRARSRRLVESHLQTPAVEHGGRSPLSVVHEERVGLWLRHMKQAPNRTWDVVVPLLVGEQGPPPGAELSMTPAVAVLEAVGEEVGMTDAGYLPAKLALALDDRFGWSAQRIGAPPRSESDLPALMSVDEHLRSRRLLTKSGKRLSVSAEGRRCLQEPARLWSALTVDRSRLPFESETLAMMATVLLASTSVRWQDLDDQVSAALAPRWRTTDGSPIAPEHVHPVELEWYRLGLAFGWWESDHGHGVRGLRLNQVGRAAAVSLARSVATRPARRPG